MTFWIYALALIGAAAIIGAVVVIAMFIHQVSKNGWNG